MTEKLLTGTLSLNTNKQMTALFVYTCLYCFHQKVQVQCIIQSVCQSVGWSHVIVKGQSSGTDTIIWATARQNKQNNVRSAKTQISLVIRPVWSESSQCASCVAKGPRFLHPDSEDSDQTGWMLRLISVFAGRTCHFVGFVMLWLE